MFEKGTPVPAKYYTGEPYYRNVFDDGTYAVVEQLTFPAGTRTNWHSNPAGQTLLVTGGALIYQEEGKEPQVVRADEVVKIAPAVAHWHGQLRETFEKAERDNTIILITYKPSEAVPLATWTGDVDEESYHTAVSKELSAAKEYN